VQIGQSISPLALTADVIAGVSFCLATVDSVGNAQRPTFVPKPVLVVFVGRRETGPARHDVPSSLAVHHLRRTASAVPSLQVAPRARPGSNRWGRFWRWVFPDASASCSIDWVNCASRCCCCASLHWECAGERYPAPKPAQVPPSSCTSACCCSAVDRQLVTTVPSKANCDVRRKSAVTRGRRAVGPTRRVLMMAHRSGLDRLCCGGAPVQNLTQSASRRVGDNIAPSKSGIKHLKLDTFRAARCRHVSDQQYGGGVGKLGAMG